MEYFLVLVMTIAGLDYEFISANTFWSIQECDEKAEEIELGFTATGAIVMEAYCIPKIGG